MYSKSRSFFKSNLKVLKVKVQLKSLESLALESQISIYFFNIDLGQNLCNAIHYGF